MKYIVFENKAVAKAKLKRFADKHDIGRRKLYWSGLESHEFQDGNFAVGFPDNYVTWMQNNAPGAASRLKDTWQEAKANPITRTLPRAK